MWPILVLLEDLKQLFCAGLFCGEGKPKLAEFLDPLANEIAILKEGVEILEKQRTLGHVLYVADAPARAFIEGIKGHTASEACGYCDIEGEWKENRIVFPFVAASDRQPLLYLSLIHI